MVKKMFRLFTVLGLLAGPAHAAELFLPSAGEDFFPATELNLELQIGTEKLVAGCSGPTTVNPGFPFWPWHGHRDTPPLRRIPRLFALNPAHHLRR